ncbi:MAG: hypothetical protein Q8K38_06320 [Burkholderiaceae bacterium]|nr:hypothetical protein [Burkholderiaceae bacterium]MDZ4144913.1 hypothetical protein [Burkholderiales bacterium]
MVTAKKKPSQTVAKVASSAKPAVAPKATPVRAPAAKSGVRGTRTAVAPPVKTEKPKKPKLVRDSFTIPKAEYAVLDELKLRSSLLAQPAKKSELLRAGIKALAVMSDAAFVIALAAVPTIKTGRPKA